MADTKKDMEFIKDKVTAAKVDLSDEEKDDEAHPYNKLIEDTEALLKGLKEQKDLISKQNEELKQNHYCTSYISVLEQNAWHSACTLTDLWLTSSLQRGASHLIY